MLDILIGILLTALGVLFVLQPASIFKHLKRNEKAENMKSTLKVTYSAIGFLLIMTAIIYLIMAVVLIFKSLNE